LLIWPTGSTRRPRAVEPTRVTKPLAASRAPRRFGFPFAPISITDALPFNRHPSRPQFYAFGLPSPRHPVKGSIGSVESVRLQTVARYRVPGIPVRFFLLYSTPRGLACAV
jgi:hypothetical protein